MEACVGAGRATISVAARSRPVYRGRRGAHHLSRKLQALGHDARLMPAKYVRPY
jgi:hypothetical protein